MVGKQKKADCLVQNGSLPFDAIMTDTQDTYPATLKAIIFADRNGVELLPLTAKMPMALLPIGARPLIEFTLEALVVAKIQHTIIVVSKEADRITQHLGSGERWGLTLEYVLSRGQESPMQVLKRLGQWLEDEAYLIVRADMLRHFNIGNFLSEAVSTSRHTVATVKGFNAGVCFIRKQPNETDIWQASDILSWNTATFKEPLLNLAEDKLNFKVLPMSGRIALLNSPKNYHQANLAVLNHLFPSLVLKTRKMHDALQVGRQSKVSLRNKGIVGDYCRIHDQAVLEENVVLSDEIIVGKATVLKNTVVLPNTYIGSALTLNNALISGNILIRVDTGDMIQVNDYLTLATVRTQTFGRFFTKILNRLFGLGVFLISLPLWPFAFLAAIWQNPGAPLHQVKFRGNLTQIDDLGVLYPLDFTTLEWATTIPLLCHLPKIWAVASGHITMVGVSLQTPTLLETLTEPWERVRFEAPIGLIGPAQLQTPVSAPLEEKLLEDAYYAKTRCMILNILWLLRGCIACFSKRTWLR